MNARQVPFATPGHTANPFRSVGTKYQGVLIHRISDAQTSLARSSQTAAGKIRVSVSGPWRPVRKISRMLLSDAKVPNSSQHIAFWTNNFVSSNSTIHKSSCHPQKLRIESFFCSPKGLLSHAAASNIQTGLEGSQPQLSWLGLISWNARKWTDVRRIKLK